jgi:S1-C subfamily serine protease
VNILNRRRLILIGLALVPLVAAACSTATPVSQEPTPTPFVGAFLPDVATVVEQTLPSVVSVLAEVERSSTFGRTRQGTSSGSGVIFDDRGYILTNNHVVEGATEVKVVLADGSEHVVEVVGRDPGTDMAVLRLDAGEGLQLVASPLGDTDAMRIGDWVIAIGNPLGFAGSVTVGVVSAKGRTLQFSQDTILEDLVQTDAVINPGNSGGPLLNLRGEVVGINTAIIRGALAGGQEAEGLGFAISMNTAIPVAEQLIANGRVIWPWLGVSVVTVNRVIAAEEGLSVDKGVLVVAILSGAPAEGAGIEAGDVIVAVDGKRIDELQDLRQVLRGEYKVGDTVSVEVMRGEWSRLFDVTLGEQPA